MRQLLGTMAITVGGELPAMVLIDSIARFLPGVIGHANATCEESFADGYLEYPHYTRPDVLVWKGKKYRVPKVLLGENHKKINSWRAKKSK